MEPKTNCPKCSAQIAPHDFVCDYCGHVLFDRVKNTDSMHSGTASFDEVMEIIKENMDALHDIPKPSTGKTIRASIRFLLALYTFGLILIFWHRPKRRFNKENYDKLKSIIRRNISFLKISCAGSNDLIARIKVLEDELNVIDKKVSAGILSKTITYIAITALFISWFFYIANQEPVKHATYAVSPYDTTLTGNLSSNISIAPDTINIVHTPSGTYEEWELIVKLKTKKLETTGKKELKITNYFDLTDDKGISIIGFKPASMESSSEKKLLHNLKNLSLKEDYYKFLIKNDINYSQYRDTIPVNAIKFTIQIDSL